MVQGFPCSRLTQDHFKVNLPKFKAAGEIHNVEFQMLEKDGPQIVVTFHNNASLLFMFCNSNNSGLNSRPSQSRVS
jgi:hypothetical protein